MSSSSSNNHLSQGNSVLAQHACITMVAVRSLHQQAAVHEAIVQQQVQIC